VEMVGVIWVAGPQYGREPSAARAPHRSHEQCLLGTRLMSDRNAPPIGEQDRGDVDRDALAVWVDLRPWNPVDAAAIVARAGVERDDRSAQHGLAERGHEVSQKPSEGDGERAVEQWMRREIELGSAVEADRRDSDRRNDAAVVGRSARRGGGFSLDMARFQFLEARFSGGLRLD